MNFLLQILNNEIIYYKPYDHACYVIWFGIHQHSKENTYKYTKVILTKKGTRKGNLY